MVMRMGIYITVAMLRSKSKMSICIYWYTIYYFKH